MEAREHHTSRKEAISSTDYSPTLYDDRKSTTECPECLSSARSTPFLSCVAALTRQYGKCDFGVPVFSFVLVLPHQYLSWYNAITSPSSLVLWTGPPITFHFAFVWVCFFWFVWLFLCCFCCCWCGLAVCCFSAMESWRLLDYVQVPYQFTFVAPIPDGGYMYALIS